MSTNRTAIGNDPKTTPAPATAHGTEAERGGGKSRTDGQGSSWGPADWDALAGTFTGPSGADVHGVPGEDVIELDAAAYARLDTALANAVQNGRDVLLSFQGGAIALFCTAAGAIPRDGSRIGA